MSFSFSVQRREEKRNIPAESKLCFLLIPNILKVSFSFSVQKTEGIENIPAALKLIQS
jgi:hypothetical protein